MDYLKKEHTNFIEPHIACVWPPNSPDINPVDYAIWGALLRLRNDLYCVEWGVKLYSLTLQQRVYHHRQLKTVEELKRAKVTEWQKLTQRFIENSINEWRRRLEGVIKNGGGLNEHCKLA